MNLLPLCCFVLVNAWLFIPIAVHGYHSLNDSNARYIEGLYNDFLTPFTQNVKPYANSVQFCVLTMSKVENDYRPHPPRFHGSVTSMVNYYAATPDFSTKPVIHCEDRLINAFNQMITNQLSITDVYILTYFSPCNNCATLLANLANNYNSGSNRQIRFHIGYMTPYLRPSGNYPNGTVRRVPTLPKTQQILQPSSNIYFGSVRNYCQRIGLQKRNANDFTCDLPAFWGEWGAWSQCDRTCEYGCRYSDRSCYYDGQAPGACTGLTLNCSPETVCDAPATTAKCDSNTTDTYCRTGTCSGGDSSNSGVSGITIFTVLLLSLFLMKE